MKNNIPYLSPAYSNYVTTGVYPHKNFHYLLFGIAGNIKCNNGKFHNFISITTTFFPEETSNYIDEALKKIWIVANAMTPEVPHIKQSLELVEECSSYGNSFEFDKEYNSIVTKLIYLTLIETSRNTQNAEIKVSYRQLAESTNSSLSNVSKSMNKLIENGLIERTVTGSFNRKNGKFTTSTYRLNPRIHEHISTHFSVDPFVHFGEKYKGDEFSKYEFVLLQYLNYSNRTIKEINATLPNKTQNKRALSALVKCGIISYDFKTRKYSFCISTSEQFDELFSVRDTTMFENRKKAEMLKAKARYIINELHAASRIKNAYSGSRKTKINEDFLDTLISLPIDQTIDADVVFSCSTGVSFFDLKINSRQKKKLRFDRERMIMRSGKSKKVYYSQRILAFLSHYRESLSTFNLELNYT